MDHLKRVADEFARQAQNFDHWAAKADDPGRFAAALGEARRGELLDVACGPGVVTAALAPEARSVTAFDATEEMLEKAKARCAKAALSNVAFRSGDAENLPFRDAEFDGVVTRLAIHHFANPQRALDQMFRVLRPGGAAVIVDVVSSENPDESNLHNAIERLRDPSHVRMLPASELDAGVSRAGFSRSRAHDLGHGPRTRRMARYRRRSCPGRTDPHRRARARRIGPHGWLRFVDRPRPGCLFSPLAPDQGAQAERRLERDDWG